VASSAPTRWKCTFSFLVPWTLASAAASRSKQPTARDFAPAGRDERRRSETISERLRTEAVRAESFTENRVPAAPAEAAFSTDRRYPRTGRPRSALRSSCSAPVSESSAAQVMSPAIPEKQSKYRILPNAPPVPSGLSLRLAADPACAVHSRLTTEEKTPAP